MGCHFDRTYGCHINYNGFYEPLKKLFSSMISEELIREDELSGVLFADSEAELMSLIEKL